MRGWGGGAASEQVPLQNSGTLLRKLSHDREAEGRGHLQRREETLHRAENLSASLVREQ